MCDDKTIKELLPAYSEQGIDKADALKVKNHLDSCADCRTELSVLRLLAKEGVPDPGEAFWAAMPGRVYRAVQEQNAGKNSFDLARLFDRMALPRWRWAAATAVAILIAAWFMSMPIQKGTETAQPQTYDFAEEMEAAGSLSVAELDNEQLDTIDSWAGGEITTMVAEAEQAVWNISEIDIDEELGALNTQEVERLSKILTEIRREG
jgi:hypothetical protein